MKILIVEDELITAYRLQNELEAAGHEVTALAKSLNEATISVRKNPPDLAIIDLSLGEKELHGTEISEILSALHPMPYLYLTGYKDSETLSKVIKTAPYAYILKPYQPEELITQVQLAYQRFAEQQATVIGKIEESEFYIRTPKGFNRIPYDQLLFVEADGSSSKIHIANQKHPLVIGTNLGNIAPHFQHRDLLKISKSLIVNRNCISYVGSDHMVLGHDKRVVTLTQPARKVLLANLNIVRTKSGDRSLPC